MISKATTFMFYEKIPILLIYIFALLFYSCQSKIELASIKVGAEQTDKYLPLLKDKKVALVVNQTSKIGEVHLVDSLLKKGVKIIKIFTPEHGFRGRADAGQTVQNSIDITTKIPIISLYGKNKKPNKALLIDIEIIIFDIQDVGVRFYTYISTMHYIMEASAENNIKLIILDRPNPNGFYFDGPILDLKQQSFIGMHPIPVVHGLTVGELALMIKGEKWLNNTIYENKKDCDLTVIKCVNYNHRLKYSLPIKPSPNLPNDKSIKLYPSLCFFEATNVSVGRGTNKQFQIIGSPDYPNKSFSFIPISKLGAKYPKHKNIKCYGKDLSNETNYKNHFFLTELIHFYQKSKDKEKFFNTSFFTKLAGNKKLQLQIINGLTENQIRDSWQRKLNNYKKTRNQYLLYDDF